MTPGNVYRHLSTLDTDIFVTGVEDIGDALSVSLLFVHRQSKRLMADQNGECIRDTVLIKKSELGKWQKVE